MFKTQHTFRKAVFALGVSAILASVPVLGHAWEPQKPVEFVVMAGKGGGADKAVRFIQSIIASENMAPVPFTPVNKPGGSGAEALVYLKGKQGDNHTIMFTLNSFYTTPLRQPGLGVDIEKFTPIARMAEDTFLLWVNSDRKDINNVEDFVKAAKAKGSDWIMAGTGKNSEDNLLTDFLNTAYGLKMKYVPYKGGGKVAKELAGNNADSTVNNPSEQLGFYEAGNTKPLASFTDQRLPMFPDAPTFKELGKDYVYYMQRTVVGAPGMSKEAAQYYQDLFTRVYNSDKWQKYLKDKSLQGELLSGDALMSYWKKERDVHRTMLKNMGVIK
ncbi:MAG: tripartite tricarboxylate transporter substrate-binding protein [Gammaproteobacteria bacterium]|nr:tripartite tricarboxylate transporter substrate-binding protein [Gammaproteobacteria bacterium]MDH3448496.1 tripartite tricarboxylate transporter substrate-binding protein [Gammaproteobacteria bacterium]